MGFANEVLFHPKRFLQITLVVLWALLMATMALCVVAVGSMKGDKTMPRVFCKVVLWIMGVKVRVSGNQPRDDGERVVYASNHRSAIDPIVLVSISSRCPRIVAKSSLTKVPYFPILFRKLGHILVDRDNTASAYQSLARAAERLGKSHDVWFAAEGKRSLTVLPFKKGAFFYAQKTGLKVVPVAFVGTEKVLPSYTYSNQPGTVYVWFGEPIAVDDINLAVEEARSQIIDHLKKQGIQD